MNVRGDSMNTIENESSNNGKIKPFPSIASLKEAHTVLIKRNREGDNNNFFNDVEKFLMRGSLTGKLLDDYNDREAGQSLLNYWVTVLLRIRRTPPDATLDEFDPSLLPQLDDSLCPYRGLNAFQETDYDIFYGRQRLIDKLIGDIKEKNILFVVGPSGSGKSSLVLAGVIPALKNGVLENSEKWQYLPRIVPGVNPLKNLAAALNIWENENQITEKFKQNNSHLLKIIEDRTATPCVLIVDQFEEIFTLCNDETLRTAFINNLITFATDSTRNNKVILTLRTDYESYVMSIPSLISFYEDGQTRVTPLTSADLRKAIEEPAKRIGLKFEPGIVDTLIKDILGEPAGLPLLQFTLLQLWEERERNRITWRNYRALGDARQALSLTAEKFYNGLIPEKQEAARRIILKMVRPGEGLEVTSNRVKRSELYRLGIPKYRIEEVLDELIKQGLVRLTKGDVPENDQLEVTHEALIRSWGQLGDWLNDERVNMRQRIRLTAASRQWLEHGRDQGSLLGGKVLEEALQYDDLDDLEKEFVEASQAAVVAAELEKAQAIERERNLEQEKLIALEQKADEETKNAKRFRRFALALALIAMFAVVAAGFALVNYEKANKNFRKSEDEKRTAMEATEEALRQKEDAERARQEAKDKSDLLEKQSTQLKDARDIAVEAGTKAEAARKEAEKQTTLANERSKEAENAKKIADEQTKLVESQRKLVAQQNKKLSRAISDLADLKFKIEQKSNIKSELIKANAELETKKFDKAKISYESLLKNPVVDEDLEMKIDVLKGLAKTYYYLSNDENNTSENQKQEYKTKVDNTIKVIEFIYTKETEKVEKESGKNSSELLLALVKRAEFYRSLKYSEEQDFDDKAEADYKQALKIQEEIVRQDPLYYNVEEYDKLVKNILEIYTNQYEIDFEQSKSLFADVLKFKRSLKEIDRSLFNAALYEELNNEAKLYGDQFDQNQAIVLYKEAYEMVREELNDNSLYFHSFVKEDLLHSLRNLANAYFLNDMSKEAEQFYQESFKLEEQLSKEFNNDSAEAAYNLGEIYNKTESYENAIKYYRLAQNFYETDSDNYKDNLISIQDRLTGLYLKQNNLNDFKSGYDDLIKLIANGKSRPPTLINLLRERAYIADEKGEIKDATEFYEKALNLFVKGGLKSDLARNPLYRRILEIDKMTERLSAIYQSQNDPKKAYDLAVSIYGEKSINSILIDNILKLAEFYEKEDFNKAEDLYKKLLENFKDREKYNNYQIPVKILESYEKMLLKIPGREKDVEQIRERIKQARENIEKKNSN